jgi:hypothetical protein
VYPLRRIENNRFLFLSSEVIFPSSSLFLPLSFFLAISPYLPTDGDVVSIEWLELHVQWMAEVDEFWKCGEIERRDGRFERAVEEEEGIEGEIKGLGSGIG